MQGGGHSAAPATDALQPRPLVLHSGTCGAPDVISGPLEGNARLYAAFGQLGPPAIAHAHPPSRSLHDPF